MSEIMQLTRKNNLVVVKETGLALGEIQKDGAIKFTKNMIGKIEFDQELDQYLSNKREASKR